MPSWDNVPKGTMHAMTLTKRNASSAAAAFTYRTDYPRPSLPNPNFCLVRVRALGLNRSEIRARKSEHVSPFEFGIYMNEFHNNCPSIIGEEFVGDVVDAGSETDFKVGDYVTGWAYGGGKAYDGSYAEYTICHRLRLWKLGEAAKDVPWDTLAAIPMGLWTAYGSLFVAAKTKPGSNVFVHGGASSVGLWGILTSKAAGCYVIASTRSESKVEKLKAAGADWVVLEPELQDPEVMKKIAAKGIDTVLELIGLQALEPIAMRVLKRGGTTVQAGILADVWRLEVGAAIAPPMRYLTAFTTFTEDYDEAQRVLIDNVKKVVKGELKKEDFWDSTFDLKDVGKAHERVESGLTCGKVIMTVS